MKTENPEMSTDHPTTSSSKQTELPAERRLYRSRDNRVFKGVAGGIGEYFGIDPVLIRLAFLLTFAMGGVGVIAYILAWVLVPKRPKGRGVPSTPRTSGLEVLHNRSLGVWILIAIGVGMILDQLKLNIAGDRLWPLLLVGGGLIVLMRRRDAGAGSADTTSSTAVRGTTGPRTGRTMARASTTDSTIGVFDGGPSRRDLQAEALAELHDPVVDELDRAVAELRAERLGAAPHVDVLEPVVSRRSRRAEPRSLLRRLVIGSLLFVALLTVLTAAVGFRLLTRGVGQRQVVVTESRSFRQVFGAGELTVDLTDLTGGKENVTGEVSLDFGQAIVRLPSGPNRPAVTVRTHGRIVAAQTGANGAGEATVFGSRIDRFARCGSGRGSVDIDLTIVAGEVQLIPGGPCPGEPARPTAARTAASR